MSRKGTVVLFSKEREGERGRGEHKRSILDYYLDLGTSDYRESERRRQKERKWARRRARGARDQQWGEQQQWGGQQSQHSSLSLLRPFSTSSLQYGRAPHRSSPSATQTLYSRAQPMHLTSECSWKPGQVVFSILFSRINKWFSLQFVRNVLYHPRPIFTFMYYFLLV